MIVQKVVDKLIDEKKGVFGEVFFTDIFSFLLDMSSELRSFHSACPHIECCEETILYALGKDALDSLIDISLRTFISEIYQKKGELKGETPEDRYEDYINRFLLRDKDVLLSEYPELERLIKNRIRLSSDAVVEVLTRLRNDSLRISQDIGLRIQKINSIHIGVGDTHNNGKSVITVEVNNDNKILYKPHTLINDILFSNIQKWFNSYAELKKKTIHPKSIDMGCYGWQEHMAFSECNSMQEVKDYMYRLGVLLFISYLTGCSDLHAENIVANGSMPVIIDIETLFSNGYAFKGKLMAQTNSWEKLLYRSVFSTLLLPFDFFANKYKKAYIEVSGILGGYDTNSSKTTEIQVVVNKGTDEIRFVHQRVNASISSCNNIPKLNGEVQNPCKFISCIIEGFQNAYEIAINNATAFLTYIINL